MREKIIKILSSKVLYKIAAIIILLILGVGFIKTYQKPYITGVDLYWLRIFYSLIFILILQSIFILLIGQVRQISKMICCIPILNMVAMLGAFLLIRIYNFIIYFSGYPIDGYIHELFLSFLWPANIWASHNWIFTVAFSVFATAIATLLLYFALFKDAKSKKLLFISLIISSLLCYSTMGLYFHLNY